MKRSRERRNIMLAVVASLILHLVVAVSLASFGDKLQSPLPEEEKPSELTIVDAPLPTPPPVTPRNPMFVDTPEKRATQEQPKEKTFESNANSIAASQLPALGEAPVPTQDGKEHPGMDLENEKYALAQNGAQPTPPVTPPPTKPTPAPTATPTPMETPSPTPPPTPTPNEELLAMFRATPPPVIRAPEETEQATPPPATTPEEQRPTPPPQQPSTAYRRQQTQTHMRGNISNHGVSSVNALGTPLGRYSKMVYDAVGSRWYGLVHQNGDRINIGTVALTFVVDRSGHITKLNMVSNSSDESFSNLCLQSVQDAKLPPIPEDVAAALPPDGLDQEVTFTIFPN
jgi:outer membrane biosynthesis protein TonB